MYKGTYLDTYQGFKHFLATKRARLYSYAKYEYLSNRKDKKCDICNIRLKHSERTIDHIIPMSIIMEKELFGLWLDERNFQLLCMACNSKKSSDLSHLPEVILNKLGIVDCGLEEGDQ